MPSEGKVGKRKGVNLIVAQKIELIKILESGTSVRWVCEEYGVKKTQLEMFINQNINLMSMMQSI